MDCPLCKIQEEKYRFIAENEHAFCTIPLDPQKPGHTMVLPKRHITSLGDFSPEESQALLSLINKMLKGLKAAYGEDTMCHINTGKYSSQEHIHFHVLPAKGSIRKHVFALEGLPENEAKSEEVMQAQRDHIVQFL